MDSKKHTPFPTAIEIIRAIATALDIQHSNKTLDDNAHNLHVDYRLASKLITEVFIHPRQQFLEPILVSQLDNVLDDALQDYLKTVVSLTNADGMVREEQLPLLHEHVFSIKLAETLITLMEKLQGPNPVFMVSFGELTTKFILDWISENEKGWAAFISRLEKEQNDRIKSWHRGDNLPSMQYIFLLHTWSQGPWSENINWPRVRLLLTLGRAIDFARRDKSGQQLIEATRISVWGATPTETIQSVISKKQQSLHQNVSVILPTIHNLQQGLKRTSSKTDQAKQDFFQQLNDARRYHLNSFETVSMNYWLDWHEARWHVYSGDIQKAVELYKKAFDGCLYRSGENQKLIIEEALVVASLITPDRPFLKKLKNSSITFGYDVPISQESIQRINKSDLIEEWEVAIWKGNFTRVFPQSGWFPSSKLDCPDSKTGPLIINNPTKHEPDYRHPNRKIKVGETWKKTMPQIVYSSEQNCVDIVEKLLNEGADVNVWSESGDTPILMALQELNVMSVPFASLDERLFKLISGHHHTPETINKRTSKKKLLPIISAIESGRLDIVEKVLDMGADPNVRGMTDNQSPLNVCLKIIGMLKNPEGFWQLQNSMPMTDEVLDSFRRHTNGIAGFTLDQQFEALNNFNNDPVFQDIQHTIQIVVTEWRKQHISLERMRDIGRLLLAHDADPNAEHQSPISGYTPLMLAAELDERKLFELMLQKGGNPAKSYIDHRTGQEINCWHIAYYWKSANVISVLNRSSNG